MKDIYFSGDGSSDKGSRNSRENNRQYRSNNNGGDSRYTYFEDIYSDSGKSSQNTANRPQQGRGSQRDIPMNRTQQNGKSYPTYYEDIDSGAYPKQGQQRHPARYEDVDSGAYPKQGQQRRPARYVDVDSGAYPKQGQQRRPAPQDISSGAKKKRKKSKMGCGCGCLTAIVAFILVIAIAGFALFRVANSLFSEMVYDDTIHSNVFVNEDDLFRSDKVTNILLIGVDRREAEEASRSDTMMLLSIDKANKKIKLTSFMRDMWVDIPGEGYAKINSSCVWGGPQLVMDTIEYNFNVDIDDYMLVDFDMFTKIVDGLGGVQVEVTEAEAAYFGSGRQYAPPMSIEAGNTLLNGEEALWYCRIRYLDDDFHRTERQRKVISAIIAKATETSPQELLQIAKDVMPYIETSISESSLMRLALGALFSYIHYDIEQQQIPADDTWEYGTRQTQSVILIDVDKNRNALYDFIYAPDAESDNGENGEE